MQRKGDRHTVKPKSVRIPDDLWAAFGRKAAEEGRTRLDVLIRLIRRYLEE